MELKQYFSPESLCAILDVLGNVENGPIKEILVSRLEDVNLEIHWLNSTSAKYIEIARCYPNHTMEYGIELADLISWLCAPLRGNDGWLKINEDIQSRYSEIVGTEGFRRSIPVSLICWVTCVPRGGLDRHYPVLLNTSASDFNLDLAFTNLTKHVLSHNWENSNEEIDTTSITLRLTGIVNALDSTNDLRNSFNSLALKLKGTVPQADENLFLGSRWISDLIETRNIVAHIGSSSNGLNLQDAWERSRDLDQIKKIMRMSAYLVANDIRERLLNTEAKNAKAWIARIEDEIEWLVGSVA